jgi:hypothetical protein
LPQRIANLVYYQVGEEGGGLDAAEISDARILVGEPLSRERQNAASPPTCPLIQSLAQEATKGSNLATEEVDETKVGAHSRDSCRGLLHQLGVVRYLRIAESLKLCKKRLTIGVRQHLHVMHRQRPWFQGDQTIARKY